MGGIGVGIGGAGYVSRDAMGRPVILDGLGRLTLRHSLTLQHGLRPGSPHAGVKAVDEDEEEAAAKKNAEEAKIKAEEEELKREEEAAAAKKKEEEEEEARLAEAKRKEEEAKAMHAKKKEEEVRAAEAKRKEEEARAAKKQAMLQTASSLHVSLEVIYPYLSIYLCV